MSDQTPDPVPGSQATTTPAGTTPPTAERGPTINIGEEFGTARRSLPPIKILLLATAGVLIIAGVYSFLHRAKPQAAGSLDNITAAEIPGHGSVLVALTFTLRNSGERSLWVHGIQGKLATSSVEESTEAVSAIDFARYF